MAEVIELDFERPVAQCECGCTEFYLLLNAYGTGWTELQGTQCVECGNVIDWVRISDDP